MWSCSNTLSARRQSLHWVCTGVHLAAHTAAVGAGIGRKASQPLHTAMDSNSLLHCLLLVCSLNRVTMFPKYCLPACYSLNCSWCVGTLRHRPLLPPLIQWDETIEPRASSLTTHVYLEKWDEIWLSIKLNNFVNSYAFFLWSNATSHWIKKDIKETNVQQISKTILSLVCYKGQAISWETFHLLLKKLSRDLVRPV